MAFPKTVYLSYGMEKAQTSGQKHKLGTRAETPDGRVFYYAQEDGTAIGTAGLIVENVAADLCSPAHVEFSTCGYH